MEDAVQYTDSESAQDAHYLARFPTAPLLYAWEEHPALTELIQRSFSSFGDIKLVSVI